MLLLMSCQLSISQKINDSIFQINNNYIDLKYNVLKWDLLKKNNQTLKEYPLFFKKIDSTIVYENKIDLMYQLDYYILYPDEYNFSLDYLIRELEIHKNLLANKSIWNYEVKTDFLLANSKQDEDKELLWYTEDVSKILKLVSSKSDEVELKTDFFLTKNNEVFQLFKIPFIEYNLITYTYKRYKKILFVEKEVYSFYRVIEDLDVIKSVYEDVSNYEINKGEFVLFGVDKNKNYFKGNFITSIETLENWHKNLVKKKLDETILSIIENNNSYFEAFKSNVVFKVN